jgi:hypothetical protein
LDNISGIWGIVVILGVVVLGGVIMMGWLKSRSRDAEIDPGRPGDDPSRGVKRGR